MNAGALQEVFSPDQMAREGQLAFRSGDFLAAARAYQAAAEGHRLQDRPDMAAEMDNNRSVALLQSGDPQAALQAVVGCAEVFATQGDTRREALAYGNHGAALEALGQLQPAADYYQRSADLLKQVGEHQLRAAVLQSLSKLQLRSGHTLQALATMQAGLSEIERPSLWQRFLKQLFDVPYRLLKNG